MPKVYVSSTFDDLKEHRERVVLALRRMRIDALAMEAYVAEPGRPLDRCLEDVRECDLYIGIVAWRYGSRPPGSAMSFTEHEYRAAVDAGKPCFVFLLAEDAPWPRSKMDRGPDGNEIERLRGELADATLAQFFNDTDQLPELVVTAVSNQLTRNAPPQPSLGVINAERLSRYYGQLHKTYGRLELDALTPPQQEEYLQIQLAQVFTEQDVREDPPPIELPKELWQKLRADREVDESDLPAGYDVSDFRRAQEAYRQKEPRPVLDVLADPEATAVVLLGDPGAGKSTVARYLTLALASATPHPRLTPVAGSLPLLVELKKFVSLRTAGRCSSFLDFLHHVAVEEGLGIERDLLEPYLAGGGAAVVVFDGLDEVFDPADRAEMSRAIAGFAHRHPGVRIVVTSRIIGYARGTLGNAGFGHFTLQELGERQVEDFLETWYGLALHDRPDDARVRRERLLEAVRASRPIRELTGNPLLLTIMAIIGKHQELPRERWRLYDHAATVLVQHWDVNRHLRDARVRADFIDERDKKELLRRLAYRMQTGKDRATGGNFIDGDELRSVIETYLAERYHRDPAEAKTIAVSMIDQFRERNFVLSRYGPDLFSFVHRTFLEFFCADHIVTRFQRDQELSLDDLRGLVDAHWSDSSWREVLRLVCSNVAERFAGELILHLVDGVNRPWPTGEFGERAPWNIVLAVQCLAEVRNPHAVAGPAERLLDVLVLLVEHGAGIEDDAANALLLDEIRPALTAVGPSWPGRERYLDWYRRRGGRLVWAPLVDVAGDALVRLFPDHPDLVTILTEGPGRSSDDRAAIALGEHLAAVVRADPRPTTISSVLAALDEAGEWSRRRFLSELPPGAEANREIWDHLAAVLRTDTGIAVVQVAADRLAAQDAALVVAVLGERARSEADPALQTELESLLLRYLPPTEVRDRLLTGAAAGSQVMQIWSEHWPEEPVPDELLHRVARTAGWQQRLSALEELLRRAPGAPAVIELALHALEHDDDDEVFESAARHLLVHGHREQVIGTAERRLAESAGLLHAAMTRIVTATTSEEALRGAARAVAERADPDDVNGALRVLDSDDHSSAPVRLLGGTPGDDTDEDTSWWWLPVASTDWEAPLVGDDVLAELLNTRPDGVERLCWGARILDRWEERGACLTALIRLLPDAPETIEVAHDRALNDPDGFVSGVAAKHLLRSGQAGEDTVRFLLRRATRVVDPGLRAILSDVLETMWDPDTAVRLLAARVATGEFDRCRSAPELETALLAAHSELEDVSTVRRYADARHPLAVRLEAVDLLLRRGRTADLDRLAVEVAKMAVDHSAEAFESLTAGLRTSCLELLVRLAGDAPAARAILRAAAHEDPDIDVGEEAARLLSGLRTTSPTDLPDADGDVPSTV